ncbi:hypothetical protein OV079_22125 [Nannocystis pusilla]|uniref:Uncharacterized protein n=1 Tax=Nannocystis pusilla TaxID=889268 RepID=A0A9X3EQV6_9BACT|nr:hypothetical protein [Nannocystis pusilla]MCY1008206.1 hypothetical protein [Nannocystis pusilla]
MNFREFLAWSGGVREPAVLRACETRISAAFADLRPPLERADPPRTVHRCDLARAWCELRGLPPAAARGAMICAGVRHALSLLFAHMAVAGRRLALPTDVYPVYWDLARAAGVATVGVATFPELAIADLLDRATRADVAALVLPDPLKLHGRSLAADERAALLAWLARDPHRRLVLDGVYSFGRRLSPATLELLASGQVLYLDSLSKGWLYPRVFGVAHLPARDFDRLGPVFRAAAPRRPTCGSPRASSPTTPSSPRRSWPRSTSTALASSPTCAPAASRRSPSSAATSSASTATPASCCAPTGSC